MAFPIDDWKFVVIIKNTTAFVLSPSYHMFSHSSTICLLFHSNICVPTSRMTLTTGSNLSSVFSSRWVSEILISSTSSLDAKSVVELSSWRICLRTREFVWFCGGKVKMLDFQRKKMLWFVGTAESSGNICFSLAYVLASGWNLMRNIIHCLQEK